METNTKMINPALNRVRLLLITQGMHLDIMFGMKLSRGVNVWKIAKEEFGVVVSKKTGGKIGAYQRFCQEHGFEAKSVLKKVP